MDEKDVCIYHYLKLKALLEADEEHVAGCLGGELLDSYREILMKEKEVLGNIIGKIY